LFLGNGAVLDSHARTAATWRALRHAFPGFRPRLLRTLAAHVPPLLPRRSSLRWFGIQTGSSAQPFNAIIVALAPSWGRLSFRSGASRRTLLPSTCAFTGRMTHSLLARHFRAVPSASSTCSPPLARAVGREVGDGGSCPHALERLQNFNLSGEFFHFLHPITHGVVCVLGHRLRNIPEFHPLRHAASVDQIVVRPSASPHQENDLFYSFNGIASLRYALHPFWAKRCVIRAVPRLSATLRGRFSP